MRKLKNSVPCKTCGEMFVPGGAIMQHQRACDPNKKRRRRSRYRDVFFATYGGGPYRCFFDCGELLEFEYVIVHHIDGDHTNDSPHNLAPAHRTCHNGHHFKELWTTHKAKLLSSPSRGHHSRHSENTKEKIRAAHKKNGHAPTSVARAKAKEINIGSKRSSSARKKMSEYAKNRTVEHQQKLNNALRNRVISKETRLRMSESARARTDRSNKRLNGGDAI